MQEPYAVEPEPAIPDLPGDVVVRPTLEDVLDPAAADLFVHATTCVRAFGDFHLAFSVGEPQLALAMRLMIDPAYRSLPWNRTHLWMICDTPVPTHDPRSRFAALAEILVDHAGIPARQIHEVPTGPGAAAAYQRELQEALAWRERGQDRLDCAVLAVGDDGRPTGFAEPADGGLVGPATLEGETAIAMTRTLINATRLISVFASGHERRAAVARMSEGDLGGFAGISPIGGSLRWYLDQDAVPTGED